jgi:acetyl esterase/lipase
MSWQARVAASFCRLVIKRPLRKSPDIATIRTVFNASWSLAPRGCAVQADILNGVRGEWLRTDSVAEMGTMLYIHGGAHVACSPVTHRPITSWFAKRGWRVFAVDYRLAPEHRFPAGLEDCVAVFEALLANGVDPKRLVVAGDSAGGNLTLALCLSLRAQQLPLPAGIAMFSPVLDFTWSGASITANTERCAMFCESILPAAARLYLDAHDPRDPFASPYFADLQGLPPMIFHASEDEILRDDSVRVADNARRAGVEAQLKTWPIVPHAWQMLHPLIPEARESLQLAHSFLASCLYRPGG